MPGRSVKELSRTARIEVTRFEIGARHGREARKADRTQRGLVADRDDVGAIALRDRCHERVVHRLIVSATTFPGGRGGVRRIFACLLRRTGCAAVLAASTGAAASAPAVGRCVLLSAARRGTGARRQQAESRNTYPEEPSS